MNLALSGFPEAFATLANVFPTSATEKIFKLALKYASGQRQGKLSDADALRVLAKADDSGPVYAALSRHELQQGVKLLQLLAAEAVAMGLTSDSYRKKLSKAVEKATAITSLVPSKDRLTETIQALAAQVSEDAIASSSIPQKLAIGSVTVLRSTAVSSSSSTGFSGKTKVATGVDEGPFVCSFIPNDLTTSQAFAARRVACARVTEAAAIALLGSSA
jgi:hypothetical protein